MDGGGPPPQCYDKIKKPSAYRASEKLGKYGLKNVKEWTIIFYWGGGGYHFWDLQTIFL